MSVAAVFPGQGAQRPGMADPWLSEPAPAAVIELAGEILGFDVAERWQDEAELARPEVAQPAVLVCSLAAHAALRERGVVPVAVAGHSLGEYAALVAAGALDLAQVIGVVAERAAAMAEAGAAAPGGMLAVLGEDAPGVAESAVAAADAGEVLVLANENSPRQVVLAGTVPALEAAAALVRDAGLRSMRLWVAGAFHSPLMAPAAERLDRALAGLDWSEPTVPVVPNLDAVPTRDPQRLAAALQRHLLSPVRWAATGRALADLGAELVVECGPTRVLGPLIEQVAPHVQTLPVRRPADLDAPAVHRHAVAA